MTQGPLTDVDARVLAILESAASQTRAVVAARAKAPVCTATRAEIEESGWRDSLCEMLESAISHSMGQLARTDFYRLERFIETLPENAPEFRKVCAEHIVKITREEAEAQRVLFHIGFLVHPSEEERAQWDDLIARANTSAFTASLQEFKHQYNELKQVAEMAHERQDDNPYMLNTHRYLIARTHGPWIDSKFQIERAAQWLATHTVKDALPGLTLYLPLEMTQDVVHDQVFWAKHVFGVGVMAWLWELATGRCIQDGSLKFGENQSDAPLTCPPLEESSVEMMVELDPDAEPPRHWVIRARLHLGTATTKREVKAESDAAANSGDKVGPGTRRPRFGFQTKMPAISITVAAAPGPFGASPATSAATAPEGKSLPPPPSSLQ